jgi:DNA-binding IclR family transcriptional regulator
MTPATFGKVVLALYRLADEQGLTCKATGNEIAAAAGVAPSTVSRCLRHLEALGDLEVYGDARAPHGRTLLLMDHPAAECFRRRVLEALGRMKREHEARQRARSEA